jgi:hypothetical protein
MFLCVLGSRAFPPKSQEVAITSDVEKEIEAIDSSVEKGLETQKKDYRIGDCLFWSLRYKQGVYCGDDKSLVMIYRRLYGDRFLFPQFINVMQQSTRRPKILPDEKTVVIHLRTGDGLNGPDCWNNVHDCRISHTIYALPKKYYDLLLPQIPAAKDGYRIELVTEFHEAENKRSSDLKLREEKYVNNVVEYFDRLGYSTALRFNKGADEDLIYMGSSHFFIQAGGGYSGLAAGIVEAKQHVNIRGPEKNYCPAHGGATFIRTPCCSAGNNGCAYLQNS